MRAAWWRPVVAVSALAALYVYATLGAAALAAVAVTVAVAVPVVAARGRAARGRVAAPFGRTRTLAVGRIVAVAVVAVAVAVVAVAAGPMVAVAAMVAAAMAAPLYMRTGHYRRLRRLRLAWLSVLDLVGGDPADPRRKWLRRRRHGVLEVRTDPGFRGWESRRVLAVRDAVAWRMGQDYEVEAPAGAAKLRLTPCAPIPESATLDLDRPARPGVLSIGQARGGHVLDAPLARFPHALVVGGTGGGKSVTLHALAAQAAQWAEVVLCDTQRVDLLGIDGPAVTRAETLDEIDAAVADARAEIEARLRRMRASGAACSDPWRVLVVDEAAALRAMAESADRKHPVLTTLPDVVRLGRKVRVIVVMAMQRPDIALLPALNAGEMRSNMSIRISAGRLRDPQGAAMALTDPDAQAEAMAVPSIPGRGVVELNGAWWPAQLLRATSSGNDPVTPTASNSATERTPAHTA